ncbi:MAG: radical SAM protein [Desulfococcaceae bacterium]|jgi:putative pyruvate formate lyase activating enzyme|nr:radical SAM protein [Desulfococcaceae bacterium]
MMEAVYTDTWKNGLLEKKLRQAKKMLSSCTLCPRKCGVNRMEGEYGVCRTGEKAWVSDYGPHFGEEAPLTGSRGSGTVFFTHCNLLCLFCQNFDISHQGAGRALGAGELAGMMLHLQKQGCHNINLVSPSHVVPQILEALLIAAESGLHLPIVYNTGGYDRVSTLRLLEGIVDIYMPDFKFTDPEIARLACDARDYPATARQAVKEMHRQVGDLYINEEGLAKRGVLLRHLILPRAMAGTREIMRFLAQEISADTYVNLMTQYRPCGRAGEIPGFGEYPDRNDFAAAFQAAAEEGIHRLHGPRRVFVLT